MNWYKNLKISMKLFIGFGVVFLLFSLLSLYSNGATRNVEDSYSYILNHANKRNEVMLKFSNHMLDMRRMVLVIALYSGQDSTINNYFEQFENEYSTILDILTEFISYVADDPVMKDSRRAEVYTEIDTVKTILDQYHINVVDKILVAARAGDIEGAKAGISESSAILADIQVYADDLITGAANTMIQVSEETTESTRLTLIIQLILSIFILFIAVIISIFIGQAITKPIHNLAKAADSISKGDLSVNIQSDSKDEIGDLSRSFAAVIGNMDNIISDINIMYDKHNEGDFEAKIDEDKYFGSFNEIVVNINKMVFSYIMIVGDILDVLEAITEGDFNKGLSLTYKGKREDAPIRTNNLKNTIRSIVSELDKIAHAGAEGDLAIRADASKYKGEWVVIIDRLNNVLDSVSHPINETSAVMYDMSKGDFSSTIKGNYKGDFAKIKNSINTTVNTIEEYISEINEKLSLISNGDLTVSIEKEYIGAFATIKVSINTISSILSKTIYKIATSSEQVLNGAKQVSTSSMSLSQGASDQANSVSRLMSSIETINSQIQVSADNANKADDLSDKSTENAKEGNNVMKRLLNSIVGIEESSNNISKIIKVIEDISFQTNLLALNAAVEAARAGEHGKGFAVVAEEVGSLAARSQKAAKETTELIQDSIMKVKEGTALAQETARTLNKIVEDVETVSDIVNKIAEASKSQAEAIVNISNGVDQISQVVQNNSSTSQESAASAEELNSQADMLKKMISYFRV